MHAVTDGHFADTSPCWDPEARFVAFLSSRCLRAVEDALFASLNFTHAQRPYLAMLTADAPNPLAPPPRQPGWEPPEEELGEDEESDDDGDAMPEVRVEPRGLSQRLTAMPRYLVITPLGARRAARPEPAAHPGAGAACAAGAAGGAARRLAALHGAAAAPHRVAAPPA